jgi:ABC-2 type transport system permease protein
MTHPLRQISDYTPFGAGVRAIQDSVFAGGPSLSALAVLAAYTVTCAVLAARFFRWQ